MPHQTSLTCPKSRWHTRRLKKCCHNALQAAVSQSPTPPNNVKNQAASAIAMPHQTPLTCPRSRWHTRRPRKCRHNAPHGAVTQSPASPNTVNVPNGCRAHEAPPNAAHMSQVIVAHAMPHKYPTIANHQSVVQHTPNYGSVKFHVHTENFLS